MWIFTVPWILDVTCILLLKIAKYLEQEGIADLPFWSSWYIVFESIDTVSRYESCRLLYDISDMFFVAHCLANLSDIPVKTTMGRYPTKLYPNTPRHDTIQYDPYQQNWSVFQKTFLNSI